MLCCFASSTLPRPISMAFLSGHAAAHGLGLFGDIDNAAAAFTHLLQNFVASDCRSDGFISGVGKIEFDGRHNGRCCRWRQFVSLWVGSPAGLPGVGAGQGRPRTWPPAMPGACPPAFPARQPKALLPDFGATARLIELCSVKPTGPFDGLKA